MPLKGQTSASAEPARGSYQLDMVGRAPLTKHLGIFFDVLENKHPSRTLSGEEVHAAFHE